MRERQKLQKKSSGIWNDLRTCQVEISGKQRRPYGPECAMNIFMGHEKFTSPKKKQNKNNLKNKYLKNKIICKVNEGGYLLSLAYCISPLKNGGSI